MNKRPVASLGFVLLALFLLESSFVQKKFRPDFPSQKLTQNLVREMSSREPKAEPLKIWVYFADKGFRSEETIKQALEETRRMLDERCLWRRSKVLTEEHLVDFCDLPVYPAYVEKLVSQVQRIRAVSRWLNAASVEATPAQAASLSRLDFVKTLDLVLSFSREEPASPARAGLDAGEDFSIDLDYGPSFSQLNQINVLSLQRLGYSGKDVIVCMMDVGFRKSHEVFRNARFLAEWDFVNNDDNVQQDFNNPQDYSDAHGTATWSLLGGFKPGQLIGPAYGASFLLAKTETTNFKQPIEEDWWVAGIEWAEARGAEVISSSLGYTDWYTFRDLDGKTAVTTKAANRPE